MVLIRLKAILLKPNIINLYIKLYYTQMKRKVIPSNLKEVFMVSRFVNLYLLQFSQPATFLFSDPLNNQFRVTIALQVKCSCLPGYNDHCMHTFYVLAKIFKLDQKDPLMFQQHYTEEELQSIFSGKRSKMYKICGKSNEGGGKSKEGGGSQRKGGKDIEGNIEPYKKENMMYDQSFKSRVNNQHTPIRQSKQQEAPYNKQQEAPYNKQQQAPYNKQQEAPYEPVITSKKQQALHRPQQPKTLQQKKKQPILTLYQLQPDYEYPLFDITVVCSICYEHLGNQTPLVKCTSTCRNYFHTKCLKFWVDYQYKNETQPSCPMCRCKFPSNIPTKIKQQNQKFIQHYQSHNVHCSHCKQDIRIKLFRCLWCIDTNLCEQCYFGWKHADHDRYVMKRNKKVGWQCTVGRSQFNMAKLDISLQYIKQFKDQHQMKILFGDNYQKFVQSHLKKQTLLEYIINSLTSVNTQISKTYKKLDYEQKDIKCCMCKKGRITQMRRLACKHFIDYKCLSFLLVNGERECPVDKSCIMPVFGSLQLTIGKK